MEFGLLMTSNFFHPNRLTFWDYLLELSVSIFWAGIIVVKIFSHLLVDSLGKPSVGVLLTGIKDPLFILFALVMADSLSCLVRPDSDSPCWLRFLSGMLFMVILTFLPATFYMSIEMWIEVVGFLLVLFRTAVGLLVRCEKISRTNPGMSVSRCFRIHM